MTTTILKKNKDGTLNVVSAKPIQIGESIDGLIGGTVNNTSSAKFRVDEILEHRKSDGNFQHEDNRWEWQRVSVTVTHIKNQELENPYKLIN